MTSFGKFRPIWTIYDQYGQFMTNLDNLSLIKRPIWVIQLGQSMQNHGEMIGVQALFQTNFDDFKPIWSSLDQFRPFETNLGQSKTNLGSSP